MNTIVISIPWQIILLVLGVIVMSYYIYLANIKAKTIAEMMKYLPSHLNKEDKFPMISYHTFNKMHERILNHVITQTKNDRYVDRNEILRDIYLKSYTINEVASLILNRHGYKFRTIYGRSSR